MEQDVTLLNETEDNTNQNARGDIMGDGHLSPNDHSSSSEATTCISGSTINPRSMTNTATTLVDLQSKVPQ